MPLLIIGSDLTIKELIFAPKTSNYLWLSNAALLGFAGGNYFSLLNLKTSGERINSLLSPAITAFTVILSYFIFKEHLKLLQWIGVIITLLVIFGFLLFNSKGKTTDKPLSRAGWWSSVATITCIALSIICSIKGAAESISLLHAIAIRLVFAFFIIAVVFFIKKEYKKVEKLDITFYAVVIIGVLAQTLGASYLWYYATFNLGISVLQVIIASLPIWVYGTDIYLLRKTKPSVFFLVTALLAGLGIYLVMS
ncbi:hypothetical protein EON78_02645 [bacterium]|nr:MAG: hypothetical protein EON78_02645 [bacterium]